MSRKQYLELPHPHRNGGVVGLSTHEAALVTALLKWVPQTLPLDAGALYIVPELGTDHGIADVVGIVLPSQWLARRVQFGAPPVTGRAAASIIASFRGFHSASKNRVRERVRMPDETFRRTLGHLRELGAITIVDDIVTVNPAVYLSGPEETVAVEAKIADWQRGLRQASAYGLFASRSYLAVPSTLALSLTARREVFSRNGVGIISIGEDVAPKVLVASRRRGRPSRLHRVLLRERLFARYQAAATG